MIYNDIISLDNLLEAWKEFLKGKRNKKDVQEFQYQLSDNIVSLHKDLENKTYAHGGYYSFNISDPKPRNIHKATVRDRLLHHALYRKLYPLFDIHFIYNSYSCRKMKGTHRALRCFVDFINEASKNNKKTLWALKCDIRKFFASVDHVILYTILRKKIPDEEIIKLIEKVVESFSSTSVGKGLPLGNLTSQLFANVYMNEFDQYIKHVLKQKYYIRYADDFVIMNRNREELVEILPKIDEFLKKQLKLSLHPDKVFIKTIASGVDFLGWVHFTKYRVLRTKTKKRMFTRLEHTSYKPEVVCSYLGLLTHGNTNKLRRKIEKFITKTSLPNAPVSPRLFGRMSVFAKL